MAKRMIIAGPPCAGKSTYARERMEHGEVLYDYDTVHQALSGMESYLHDQRIRPYVLAARDAIIGLLEREKEQGCWVITSTPKAAEIESLKQRLGAEVVLLMVDQEEAHRRCDADHRPAEWHEYIDNWYRRADVAAEKCLSKGWQKEREMHKTKTFRGRMQLKEGGQPGEFEAVFATLNVKDLDGDVTLPGAFTDGEQVRIAAWGHAWGDLPVGRGEIHEADDQAVVDGAFFLDTQAGKEHYQTVKNLGDLQEWSYGFEVLGSEEGEFEGEKVRFLKKLKVFEVSPVMLGAGIGTHTTDIKAGARHTAKEYEMIQEIHDLAVSLGAKCAEPPEDSQDDGGDAEGAGQGKDGSSGQLRSQALSTVARMEPWLRTFE